MTKKQWQAFCEFKEIFYKKVEEWKKLAPELAELQRQAALAAKTPEYPFETSVVYNRDLDKLTEDDEINLIVIGDNPGKDEQLAKNNRYLVGQAGKIADGFFKRNPELQTDFRKNVIILNKTPVHSAKTAQLRKIMHDGGEKIRTLVKESQLWMAEQTARLHCELVKGAAHNERLFSVPELWLVGYSELKEKGFFVPYKNRLKEAYFTTEFGAGFGATDSAVADFDAWNKVYVFQHFSMNRFTIDLREFSQSVDDGTLLQKIHALGELHKKEIFG